MNRSPERYLVDSNALITPYQQYYPFDIAPSFWSQMLQSIANNDVIVLDMIRDEVAKGEDPLADWIRDPSIVPFNHKTQEIIERYSDVLNYIQQCEFYKEEALHKWADNKSADAWLIATAIVEDWIIVTFEARSGKLNAHSPSSSAKIPDVCDHFGVSCINLYEMMRRLGFTLS